jgi:RNA-directed DNA polymerase
VTQKVANMNRAVPVMEVPPSKCTMSQLTVAAGPIGRSVPGCGGADGVTWGAYGVGLAERLWDLHNRVQGGSYRAKPSRRVYIPKADGRLRPLGIASLEDKIVERAVVEVLNAIYEEGFLGFSYRFRPGRSQQDARDALAVGISRKKVNWILDADIRDFLSKLDQAWLRKLLEHRVCGQTGPEADR